MQDESLDRIPLLTRNEKEGLKNIAMKLSGIESVVRVIFFGSRRRGDFTGDSDFDILVVVRDLRHRKEIIQVLHDIELGLEIPLSPTIYTEKEYVINRDMKSAFIKNIENEGVVLYDAHQ